MRVSGYFHILPELRDAFRGERFEAQHPERYPVFSEDESGVVRVDDAIATTQRAELGAPDARGPSGRAQGPVSEASRLRRPSPALPESYG
jgi:hypothetical protein